MTNVASGEVIIKTKDHGDTVLETELLLAPRTQISLSYIEDDSADYVNMVVSDTQLDIEELSGQITLDTLEDYIKALKKMYNQLKRKTS